MTKANIVRTVKLRDKALKDLEDKPVKMSCVMIKHTQKEKDLGELTNKLGSKTSICDTMKEKMNEMVNKRDKIVQIAEAPIIQL